MSAVVRRRIEIAVLVVVIVVALVMFFGQLGPAPLLLLPWLVAAAVGTHLATTPTPQPDSSAE